jgi:arylsulfatase A-like enzyme
VSMLLGLACEPPVATDRIALELASRGPINVVLIVVDTLRADWTTPYGGDSRISPELGRWAERGVVFENAIAQSSWTKTSMASLMTSLWPQRHGVRATRDALATGALTVAEVFSKAGYQTYAVQSNGWLEQTFGFHQGFDHYLFPRGGNLAGMKPMIWPHADNVYLEAARLLENRDPGRPFFLYLHFMDVHEYASPSDLEGFGAGHVGAYRASIAWVDEVIERFRKKLETWGALEHTVLVLASDHGEAFGENGNNGHARDLHAPVLGVPLVIRFPFVLDPVRVPAQVRNIDIAPTLLDVAGLAIPQEFQGESLLSTLPGGPGHDDPRPAFASLAARLYADSRLQEAANDGQWTLIRNVDDAGGELLFDRSVDPGENVNLIDLETQAATRMRALLDTHVEQQPRPDTVDQGVRIHPALADKLRALGYGT